MKSRLSLSLLLSLGFIPFLPCAASAADSLMLAPQTLRSDEATLLWQKPVPVRAGLIYEVLRDGLPVGTTTKTHFTATALTPGHDYVFTVVARSASGDEVLPAGGPLSVHTRAKEPIVSVLDHG
ncbi:MAG: hypothetical protein RIQ79_2347, partial [Verrucomicrobiota bacterium]